MVNRSFRDFGGWKSSSTRTLKRAVAKLGSIDLKNIIAQALHMGDEVHNRNRAATSIFYRAIAPAIVTTCEDPATAAAVLEFINHNDHFFLNLSMPASKVTLDAARGIRNSSIAGRDGPQWHGFRRATGGHRRRMVHWTRGCAGCAVLSRVLEGGREP
jgi:hypothetical protein